MTDTSRPMRPLLRSLLHHRRMNLAVAAGAAVATAVLAGALLVGDSIRGSLRQLTLERLGGIDHALVAQRFFSTSLVDRLARQPGFDEAFSNLAPAIVLRASAQNPDGGNRASGVGLQGVDRAFFTLFGGEDAVDPLADAPSGPFPPVVINQALANALDRAVGDAILIHLRRWSQVPRGSLLGRKETDAVVETVRLSVAAIVPDDGLGRFGLAVQQSQPFNAFVPIAALQRALDQEGTVNALFLTDHPERSEAADPSTFLRSGLALDDFGLALRTRGDEPVFRLESDELILRPDVVSAATEAASAAGVTSQPVYAYLANELIVGERNVPYAAVAALDPVAGPLGGLPIETTESTGLQVAPVLGTDEVLLNRWAADDLDARVGDLLTLRYFKVGPREELIEAEDRFTVAGIVTLDGLGADETLVQDVPGMADTENMADWDPPFPVDLGRIRPRDEDYWDLYRDTPKAFFGLTGGRELWRTRWGDTTGLRLAGTENGPDAADGFADALLERLSLEASGLAFRPVKSEGLEAAGGATDFAGLFLGFSMFLIASAALIASMLFRLGVERRASDIGLQLAVGYPRQRVRRQLLAEGTLVAAAGALFGLLGAVGYAALMMHLLRTRWLPAVGTSRLDLFVTPASLVAGALAAIVVVALTIAWTVRRVAKLPPTRLLRGVTETPHDPRRGTRAGWVALICLGSAAALLGYALRGGGQTDPGLFFAAGPLLLIGLLALVARRLARGGQAIADRPGLAALLTMAAANGGRNPGRSLLSMILVASATFMVVTVAAFQHEFGNEPLGRDSGTGGFALTAESDVPLHYDLNDPDGRFALGISDGPESPLRSTEVFPLRLRPGDDTSCLNLYQPTQPRVLGVPPDLVARGGFGFKQTLEDTPNPWTLLDMELPDGAVPAIGDANSMQWILKVGLGEDLVVEGTGGEPVRLRLVGFLATSIFQREVLIAEHQFVRHFPDQEGFQSFLLAPPAGQEQAVSTALERDLAPYGFDAVPSADALDAFHAVQNTYLSTFRTLGGLGLLLGTIGLAIVLLRNVLERRSELATLRAFGFGRRALTSMVLAENAMLLVGGLAIGTIAALLTVAPHLTSPGSNVPWSSLVATLGTILAVGLVACAVSASAALRVPLLPALKADA